MPELARQISGDGFWRRISGDGFFRGGFLAADFWRILAAEFVAADFGAAEIAQHHLAETPADFAADFFKA